MSLYKTHIRKCPFYKYLDFDDGSDGHYCIRDGDDVYLHCIVMDDLKIIAGFDNQRRMQIKDFLSWWLCTASRNIYNIEKRMICLENAFLDKQHIWKSDLIIMKSMRD